MTEIPKTRCLKILCKFSFVAKNTWRHKYTTNSFKTNECFILKNHIRSHIKAFNYFQQERHPTRSNKSRSPTPRRTTKE